MRYTQESCKLLYKSEIAPGIYNYTLSAPAIAGAASAGQFVQILCGDYTLRRPISICGFDAGLGILRLVFEIRGKGTAWLAQRQTGDNLDIVGPLGHGFPAADPAKKAVLVGGGIGTPAAASRRPVLWRQRHGDHRLPQRGPPPSCRRISQRRARIRCCVPTMVPPDFTALPPKRWSSIWRRTPATWCIPAAPR